MSNTAINSFTKEAIKARMLQNATNLWGVKNPLALDPFVRLLIEAFSMEVSHAANETQNIESRLLEKIAKLLTPELLVMPRAAHGIMQARPIENEHNLNPLTHFYTQKRIASRSDGMLDSNVDILFTPVDHVHLINGKISFIATGRQLFSIDGMGNKFPIQRSTTPLPWATCWLGLELENVENLENTALYFDFPSYQTQPWVYQLLPLCKISINETEEIKKHDGLLYQSPQEKSLEEEIYKSYDLMHKVLQDVKTLYDYKFLILDNCETSQVNKNSLPEALVHSFGLKILQEKVKKPLVWMQIKFPTNYTYDILENMYASINAFPVISRSLKENTYNYRALNNILPLNTDTNEHYMAVYKVTDGNDRHFSEIPFQRIDNGSQGHYSIRHGGVERFDQRSAQDMVKYLMELARDEIAAFAAINQDFIVRILEELSKQLRLLESRIEKVENDIHQVPTYLIVEPYDNETHLHVEYWVTQCELANSLRTSTPFLARNNTDLQSSSIILLTDTTGGREKLQSGDRLDAYRFALGSRGRLVTNEDIRNFCKYELGDKLKDIQFEKGLALSNHPKQGYIRTLDIKLIPNNYMDLQPQEWDYLANNLFIKIKANSADGINYRVMVENNNDVISSDVILN